MGSLKLPVRGDIGIDTPVLLYTVDRRPEFEALLNPLWDAVARSAIVVVVSELVWLEAFVLAYRAGDQQRIDELGKLLNMPGIRQVPISKEVLQSAAKLRASIRIKTPDAIHVATAIRSGCVSLITNDGGLRSVPELSIQVLSDFLTP